MTEAEWLAIGPPEDWLRVVEFVHSRTSGRKLRLFAVACCQHVAHLLDATDSASRNAIETAGRFADGQASTEELAQARAAAAEYSDFDEGDHPADMARAAATYVAEGDVLTAADAVLSYAMQPSMNPEWGATANYQSDLVLLWKLLHDIVGDSFPPRSFHTHLRSSTVTLLAEAIYADRAFDRLPILADALEDAGCDNRDILDHCRGPGPHVRGCWVVDLVLGKS